MARPSPIFRIRMVISAGAGDEGYCSQRRHDGLLGRNGSSEVGLNWGEVSWAGSGLRAPARHGVRSAVFDFPTRRQQGLVALGIVHSWGADRVPSR